MGLGGQVTVPQPLGEGGGGVFGCGCVCVGGQSAYIPGVNIQHSTVHVCDF